MLVRSVKEEQLVYVGPSANIPNNCARRSESAHRYLVCTRRRNASIRGTNSLKTIKEPVVVEAASDHARVVDGIGECSDNRRVADRGEGAGRHIIEETICVRISVADDLPEVVQAVKVG